MAPHDPLMPITLHSQESTRIRDDKYSPHANHNLVKLDFINPSMSF